MTPKTFLAMLSALLAAGALILTGQQANISGVITGGEKPAIAVPDFRGSGDAQKMMNTFNATLWNELDGSGVLKMVPKTY
jgi:TolB protein